MFLMTGISDQPQKEKCTTAKWGELFPPVGNRTLFFFFFLRNRNLQGTPPSPTGLNTTVRLRNSANTAGMIMMMMMMMIKKKLMISSEDPLDAFDQNQANWCFLSNHTYILLH